MQKNLPGFKSLIVLCLFILQYSCTKIDSTTLGGNLIPAVDNVNTFDTVLTIDATQGIFDDTTRLLSTEYHLLGSITNDPVFGQTHATVYLQLKPTFFPYYFGNPNDTINNTLAAGTGFDSAVLCLSYKGFYGDTTQPQRVSVHALSSSTTNFTNDTSYFINFQPDVPPGPSIGTATFAPQDLKNWQYLSTKKDSVNFQVRIKLNDDYFRNVLLGNLDTSAAGSGNNIYRSDSIFKSLMKGFAVTSDQLPGSNGLFYIDLTDMQTRLEIHYRRKNNNRLDTVISAFSFIHPTLPVNVSRSAHANNINRDRATGNPEFPNAPKADAIYLQSVPGTYASLKIPALSMLDNRIIHRAEIIAEQIHGSASDNVLPPPPFLYIDLKDTGAAERYKSIYLDLNPAAFYDPDNPSFPFPSQGISLLYFGGFRQWKKDAFGNTIAYYNFNVSRYVQSLVTKAGTNFDMRLYAPFILHYFDRSIVFPGGDFLLGNGRVVIGNGNNANYKLRMRIVYSKI
ncbi:MAG TPA: DUF4270 family protein [Ferruginibacter sp.]|nr:DUF4270 family protein [Ferruginibacter sp.]HMP21572.1 DUF4270 family protein [Ferruginibacter sp.]